MPMSPYVVNMVTGVLAGGCASIVILLLLTNVTRWLRLFNVRVKASTVVSGSKREVFWWLADFSTTAEWDPNVKAARRLIRKAQQPAVGDTFEVTTLWKGNQSEMTYRLTGVDEASGTIELAGESEMACATDMIRISEADDSTDAQPRTRVDYTLDVELRGWRHPLIGFISGDLHTLGRESIAGLEAACARRFGPPANTSGPPAAAGDRAEGLHHRRGR